jgi:signal transduction histidine kinase
MTARASSAPSRLDSLAARMLVVSAALAIVVSTVFVLLVLAVSDLSRAASREAEAKDVMAATVSLQKLVLDLEIGVRGFAINGDERFLRPWNEARARLPGQLREFVRRAGDDAEAAREARALATLIQEYVRDYTIPLVQIARDSPEAAQSSDAVEEGRRRVEEINRRFDRFIAGDREEVVATAASANEQADRALALGIAGVVLSGLLIVLVGVYLTRWIARPVRDVAEAAGRVARGELSLRLEERGPGEVGYLTRSFNAMARDLNERRRQLERQNAQLRQSEQLKSELVSIVSHEIRTPLASVLGFTSVLLQRDLDPESERRYLEIIDAQGRRLAALLNDFLDVQRIEEGRFELAHTPVDLRDLVREQIALFAAGSERHEIDADLPDEEQLVVVGDADRLAQVLGNLLSNAIKYSPEGGRVHVTGERTNGAVRIGVTDEGIGIPPSHQDRIFTKFFRGDAAASGIAGSGLGLALARAIVEAHGGWIGFTSHVGQGTTFSIELPTTDEP